MLLCIFPDPTQYTGIFHTPMTRYSLFVLKVPLKHQSTDRPVRPTNQRTAFSANIASSQRHRTGPFNYGSL